MKAALAPVKVTMGESMRGAEMELGRAGLILYVSRCPPAGQGRPTLHATLLGIFLRPRCQVMPTLGCPSLADPSPLGLERLLSG